MQHDASEHFAEVLLPSLPFVDFAIAYGSAVFHQPGLYDKGQAAAGDAPMVDFIFAVADPVEWHRQNIERNGAHYSFLKLFGPGAVACAAEAIGAGVYFNTLVPWENRLMKYGVVSMTSLLRDLTTWNTLYVSGRMQKPVLILRQAHELSVANRSNLQAALNTSFLQLPACFTSQDLYRSVCGLSYRGDMRMGFAEDSRKVDRIVHGSWEKLHSMYQPLLDVEVQRGAVASVGPDKWEQDVHPTAVATRVVQLPQAVRVSLAQQVGLGQPGSLGAAEWVHAVGERVALGGRAGDLVHTAVAHIVKASSRRQAILGLLSAGMMKSARYFGSKLIKSWRSRV